MLNTLFSALLDSLIDALKILPFLFLAYLLIEYIEHKASHRLISMLSRFGRFSPAVGAATGIVPQCGFSVASAKLYAGRIISFGTIAAVFIATSDEAIPILLSHPESYGYIWKLAVIKFAVAAAAGFILDELFKGESSDKSHSDAHEHLHEGCPHDECEHGVLLPAVKHTLTSMLFVFAALAAVNIIVAFVGENAISSIFPQSRMLQPLIASIFGFIPNCASSIILTELFVQGAISFGALMSGLVTNAGVSYIVLFRSNKNQKRNIILTCIIFFLSLLCGYITQLFPNL